MFDDSTLNEEHTLMLGECLGLKICKTGNTQYHLRCNEELQLGVQ